MFALTPFERRNLDLWNSFRDFENSFFREEKTSKICKTDISEEKDRFILESEMPGFDKEDIKLNIDGDFLILSAEQKTETEDKDKEGKYICRERSYGSYKRSFNISNVDTENIDAEYKNGVLTISLPKKIPAAPASKRIDIK